MKSVYLIRGNNGKYKIGIAKDPKKRLKQLKTGNSDKLQLIETYQSENASKIESVFHRQYGYVRNEGEWFDLSISNECNFLKRCEQIDRSIGALQEMGSPFL